MIAKHELMLRKGWHELAICLCFSYENVFVQRFVWVCMLYARNNTLSQILAHFYQYAGVYVKCGIMEIHNLNRQKS